VLSAVAGIGVKDALFAIAGEITAAKAAENAPAPTAVGWTP
jgi:hypothetical protein